MLRKFHINITGCVGIIVFWSVTIFLTFKEKIFYIKLFETIVSGIYFHDLLKFNAKTQILLILFQCKLLEFTFEVC